MDHTRWLDDDEQRTWRAYLAATRLVSDRIERQMTQDAKMPQTYYELLVRLSEAPGRTLRMSALATTANSSRSRLSHAVARLEEAGWVRRNACPTDRRGALAELTDEGMAVLEKTAPGHVETVRSALFDHLSPEQRDALRDIAETLVKGLGVTPSWLIAGDCPDGDCPEVDGAEADAADDCPGEQAAEGPAA